MNEGFQCLLILNQSDPENTLPLSVLAFQYLDKIIVQFSNKK